MNSDSYLILLALFALVASPYLLKRLARSQSGRYGAFAVGDRDFGWFRIGAGLSATFVGGAAVINLAGLGYTFGWYGLADVLPTSLALIFTALVVVPRLVGRDGIAVGGYVTGSNRLAGMAVGLLSVVVYTLVTAAQIVALTKLLQPYFPGVPGPLIGGLGGLAVTSYILFGGYNSVTVTDVIQFIVMGTCYFALVGITLLMGGHAELGAAAVQAKSMDFDLILLLALSFLFIPVSQDVHLRVNSARSSKDARLGVILAGVCYFVFGLVSVSVGMSLAHSGVVLVNPDDAVATFLTRQFGGFAILPTVAVLCVVVSTLDSVLFASASALAYDFWDRLSIRKSDQDTARPRVATVLVLSVALVIAIQAPQVLRLILSALVIYIAVLLPMLAGRYFGKSSKGIAIVGLVALVLCIAVEVYGVSAAYRVFVESGVHLLAVLCLKREDQR
jgi:Na+/proline symporter